MADTYTHALQQKTTIKIPLVWQGVFWKVFSLGCFAVINILVKYFSGSSPFLITKPMPIYAIIFFQTFFGILILIPIAFKTKQLKNLLSPEVPHLHILRLFVAILGIYLLYISYHFMTIIEVTALTFIGPVLTMAGAKLILREHLNWQKLTAFALSLIGGYLIIRPDKGISTINLGIVVLFPVIASILFAFSKILSRKILTNTNNSQVFTLTFYLMGASAIFYAFPCFYYGFPKINLLNFSLLILLGILCAIAHLSFSKAHKLAEVSFLLPFALSKCVLYGIAAYIAFNELPNSLSMWIGISVVVTSSIILNIKSRKLVQG